MGLTGKQKKLIRRKIKHQSLEEIVTRLGVDRQEAVRYLEKLGWRDETEGKKFSLWRWLKQNKISLIFLAVLALIAYLNAWGAEFVSDDVYGIVDNQYLGEFKRIWAHPMAVIRPFYYWSIFKLFGRVPAAFRALNIFSHVLMVLAIYLLVDLLVERRAALLAGVLVAVHPILAEAVTWISGGGHAQYALFLVISLILYILAGKERKYYWWSLFAYFIALEFSEKAASFPGILLLYQLVLDRKRKWWESLPFFGLSGLWAWVFLKNAAVRLHVLAEEFATDVRPLNPFIQIPVGIVSYLSLIFWPDKLTLYHSELSVNQVQYWIVVAVFLLVLGTILVSFWLSFKEKFWAKHLCFWLSWLLIAMAPTLTPLGVAWVVAERYVYFGAVGILILVAIGVSRLSQKQGWYEMVMIGFTVVALALLVRTVVRNHDWQNQDNLWLAAARTSPNSPQNNNNLGDYYGRMGDLERAAWHFKRAAELRPGYADPIHNLGNIYFQMGKYEEAAKTYELALSYKPKLWQSHQALAGIYYKYGNLDKAIEEMEKALQIVPDNHQVQELLVKLKAEQAKQKGQSVDQVSQEDSGN